MSRCCEKPIMVKNSNGIIRPSYVPWNGFCKRSSGGQKRCGKFRTMEDNDDRKEKQWQNNQKVVNLFTSQEEELVIQLHAAIGSRWLIIAQQLPGKTENDVKFLWNSKLRKRLTAMGIDPVTHKPFSQILADYGNIGGPRYDAVNNTDLYSQIRAINSASEPPKPERNDSDCQEETSSFRWTDFLVDVAVGDEFPTPEAGNIDSVVALDDGFEASSSSISSSPSFVDAMIERNQEPLFPTFCDEQFYN